MVSYSIFIPAHAVPAKPTASSRCEWSFDPRSDPEV